MSYRGELIDQYGSSAVDEIERAALIEVRDRVMGEPFFPNYDGPKHGNAAAFRDYQRRVLRIIEETAIGGRE